MECHKRSIVFRVVIRLKKVVVAVEQGIEFRVCFKGGIGGVALS
jgi:hypothetical protein